MGCATGAFELGPAIDGERRRWKPAGNALGVACVYAADRNGGRPVLFIHDLRATSSACEIRPLFECFRWRRPTYAIDLPGFGLSDRAVVPYSPALYAAVVAELGRKLRRRAAIDLVALGRGAEVAARVVRDDRALARSLVLIEPSGLMPVRGAALESMAARLAGAIGEAAERRLYAIATWGPFVRRAVAARFTGAPDESLVAYCQRSARAPGAHHAPMQVARNGATPTQAALLYREVTVPVLVVHDGPEDCASNLDAFLRGRPNRYAVRISPTRGMPHYERRSETAAALDQFWQSVPLAAWDRAMR
jgi:pimeloyl-ACP methyl ester carboxylesterase